jgi:hypothetical protein
MSNLVFVVVAAVSLTLSFAIPSVRSQSWTESELLVLFGLALYLLAGLSRFNTARRRGPVQRDDVPAPAGPPLLLD